MARRQHYLITTHYSNDREEQYECLTLELATVYFAIVKNEALLRSLLKAAFIPSHLITAVRLSEYVPAHGNYATLEHYSHGDELS